MRGLKLLVSVVPPLLQQFASGLPTGLEVASALALLALLLDILVHQTCPSWKAAGDRSLLSLALSPVVLGLVLFVAGIPSLLDQLGGPGASPLILEVSALLAQGLIAGTGAPRRV